MLPFSRRGVLQGLGLAAMAAGRPAGAEVKWRSRPTFAPAGWLKHRIDLTADRMLRGRTPEYSDEMVLADIRVDMRRRFAEWSGDVSGRYLGCLALMPTGDCDTRLPRLAREIVAGQKPDGRFGKTELAFTTEAVSKPHMSLLWGNGRLLVGLVEYHDATGDVQVLAAAKRLGDFLVSMKDAYFPTQVREKSVGWGAPGHICFTQCNEGLAMLGARTRDRKYLKAAAEIGSQLDVRGKQHTHGYLCTLRGAMMLFEGSGDRAALDFARTRFDDLVASPDYLIYGGVPEYFGDNGVGKLKRDEGCSEADFVRLALQLWRATRDVRYLEHAEHSFHNAFLHGQHVTGDFGSFNFSDHGFRPIDGVGRAWWCCTMHGYRTFRDVLDAAVTTAGGITQVNLYLPGRSAAVAIEETRAEPGQIAYAIGAEGPLSLRRPSWAGAVKARLGGAPVELRERDGMLATKLARGQTLELAFTLKTRLQKRDGKTLALTDVGEQPTEAALHHGPWLLGVDDGIEPLFFGEPWQANLLLVGNHGAAATPAQGPLAIPSARLRFDYRHGGFPGTESVVLRPISEQSNREPGAVAYWLKFGRAPSS